MDCENDRIAQWCNNKDVKKVQLKSVPGPRDKGPNVFKGDILNMCQECRKANNGGFKILK